MRGYLVIHTEAKGSRAVLTVEPVGRLIFLDLPRGRLNICAVHPYSAPEKFQYQEEVEVPDWMAVIPEGAVGDKRGRHVLLTEQADINALFRLVEALTGNMPSWCT